MAVQFKFDFFGSRDLCRIVPVGMVAHAEDRDMVLGGIDGDVTTNECQSFINKLHFLPPPPSNNIGNLMVDERDGARLHGMQTFYEFTHDRRDLDKASRVVGCVFFTRATTQRTAASCGPANVNSVGRTRKSTTTAHVLYSGTENGDVIEHIVQHGETDSGKSFGLE